jgi:hypothetical protein
MAAQLQAAWINRDDQEWLGRWARQWATDPANHYYDPNKPPNEMDRQLLSLFDAIAACSSDIDERLDVLHAMWKRSGLIAKTTYTARTYFLFRQVGQEVVIRAASLKTDSASQMVLNWNRVQTIYNGQNGEFQAAKAWIGPAITPAGVDPVAPGEAVTQDRYRGGRYYSAGGSIYEGPLVDLAMYISRSWRARRARKLQANAASSHPEDLLDTSRDDEVVTDA